MAVPRLAVLLGAGVVLVVAAFVMSRAATGAGEEPAPPTPATVAARPPTPSKGKAAAATPEPKRQTNKSRPEPARRGAKPRTPNRAAAARKKARAAGLPAAVAAALAKNHTVVLLLTDGKAADDRSTTNAVRGLKGRAPKTRVFTDRLEKLGSYRAIVGRVAVSQSPAVIIVKGARARVVEGYVDPETLLQQVLDARR